MRKNITGIIFLILIATSAVSYADERHGPEWLDMTIGARATALGKAFAAFADDATTAFNNPGGLPNIFSGATDNKMWISASYSNIPDKRNLGAFTTAFKIKNWAFAVSGIYTRGINEYSPYRGVDGAGDTYRLPGDGGQDYAYMPMISFATTLPDNETISFGGSVKFFKEKADGVKGSGMMFDFGGYIQVMNLISIGFVIQNMGFVKYDDMKTRFAAPTVKAGIGYNPLSRRNFALCVHIERDFGSSDEKYIGSGGLFIAVWSKDYLSSSSRDPEAIDSDSGSAPRKKVLYNAVYLNFGFHGKELTMGTTFYLFGFKLDYGFAIHSTRTNEYSHHVTLERRF
jgi:hypothetical protein